MRIVKEREIRNSLSLTASFPTFCANRKWAVGDTSSRRATQSVFCKPQYIAKNVDIYRTSCYSGGVYITRYSAHHAHTTQYFGMRVLLCQGLGGSFYKFGIFAEKINFFWFFCLLTHNRFRRINLTLLRRPHFFCAKEMGERTQLRRGSFESPSP